MAARMFRMTYDHDDVSACLGYLNALESALSDSKARIRELEDALLDLFSFGYVRKTQAYMKKHGLERRPVALLSSPSTGEKASTEGENNPNI